MNAIDWLAAGVCLALFGYLTFALLRPEKFQ